MNENDYLRRGDVLSRFTYYQGDRIPEVDVDNFPTTITFRDAKRVIREVSAADVRPVVHAWWVYRGFENGWECSNCHSRCLLNYESDFQTSTFCPHCGAQMDGTEATT